MEWYLRSNATSRARFDAVNPEKIEFAYTIHGWVFDSESNGIGHLTLRTLLPKSTLVAKSWLSFSGKDETCEINELIL